MKRQFAALARVSSREQEREGFSLEVQEVALNRHAEDKKDNFKQQNVVVGSEEGFELLTREGIAKSSARKLSGTTTLHEIKNQIAWLEFRKPGNRPAMLRRAIEEKLGRSISENAANPERSEDEVIEAAEQGILQLSRGSAESTTFDLAMLREERFQRYVEVYEADDKAALYGLTTGFPDLDRLLTGLTLAGVS